MIYSDGLIYLERVRHVTAFACGDVTVIHRGKIKRGWQFWSKFEHTSKTPLRAAHDVSYAPQGVLDMEDGAARYE